MAALSVRLANPAWDLVIFTATLVIGGASFSSHARAPLIVTTLVAVGLLKLRLACADRLRDGGLRPEGVGSKLNDIFSWVVLSCGATAFVALSLHR